MTVTRRNFLRTGTMIALSAALPLSLASFAAGQERRAKVPNPDVPFVMPAEAQRNPLSRYTQQTFAPYVNTIFSTNSEHLAEIVLIEVKETPLVVDRRAAKVPAGECFTLVFRGTSAKRFPQNTYRIEHAALGTFDMFITPTDRPSRDVQYYTAVINRRM